MKQVLAAYGGSAPSLRMLARAADLARPGDVLTVVNVMREPGVGARLEPPIGERTEQWHVLEEAQQFLADRGLDVRTLASVGDTAQAILAAAREIRADVIGIAQHRGRRPHVLGSITGRTVRSAECDVLVVHEGPGG